MIIAIYGSRRQDANKYAISKFIDTLRARGAEIVMHSRLYDSLAILLPEAIVGIPRIDDITDYEADIAISFGGDGTFLRTAMWIGERETPILGVNTGHLGYLTTARISDLPDIVNELFEGNYSIENRSLIHVAHPAIPTWPYALNEVVVAKYETSSMIIADTSINGNPLASYRADGLIIATPTGSTAYNLSVGGPLIQPSAPVWVLSPISAHSLGMRPLVVSDDADVTISVDSRASGFRLTLDGRSCTLPLGARIELRRATFVVRLICRKGHEFPNALRTKLLWGMDRV